jgi:fatty acid desaturase
MSAYPLSYSQSPPEKRNRLTVFFRLLLVIPHLIVAFFYGLAAYVVVILAWFAILFTGKYPRGMYDFVAGFLRFYTRLNAYCYLVVDQYPPFDGADHSEYPVRLNIGPPQEKYNRLTVFFRGILAIPIFVLAYVFGIWIEVVAIAIWLVAVVMGRTSPGLTEAVHFPMSYNSRAMGYVFLMTDIYPPVSDTDTLPHLSQPVG